MKKALISAVSFATLATTAIAADLPSRKAPIVAASPPMWTGFYAGLNAGYNFGTNSNIGTESYAAPWTYGNDLAPGRSLGPAVIPAPGYVGMPAAIAAGPLSMSGVASNTQSGFIGGGQIGYNYQYGSNILLGVEADIQGTGIRGASTTTGAAATSFVARPAIDLRGLPGAIHPNNSIGSSVVQGGLDWLGTVRGRIGYLWTPTLLVYGTGGFAYGGAWANVAQSSFESFGFATAAGAEIFSNFKATWIGGGMQNQILTGWTAGGGVEWMFIPNWSLKAEALYWDLGRMNVETVAYGVSPNSNFRNNLVTAGRTSVQYSGVMARAGINYHFNWGSAPVVASY